jgi:ABC-type multidrug transport system ATPase subunit
MHIELEELVVYRGTFRAVSGVSLAVERQWLGVVGANGSGKTSLLRAIAGRLPAQGGAIRIDAIDRTAERAWGANAIGFAPEGASLPGTLTGRELFAIVGNPAAGMEPNDPLAQLRRALDFDRLLDWRIEALSAGMRQRLAIFSAFLRRPQAVILDEPFNWLDPICAFDTKEALRALVADRGLTLITALHEMNTLVHHCGSGLLLANGTVSWRLGPAELAVGARDYAAFEAEMIARLRAAAAS